MRGKGKKLICVDVICRWNVRVRGRKRSGYMRISVQVGGQEEREIGGYV